MEDVRRMVARGDRVAIATVVDTRRSAPRPLGSRLAVSSAGEMVGSVSGGCVESDVYLRAEEVLAGGPPQLLQYGISDDDAFDVGLPCGGEIEVFVQMLDPEELDRIGAADERGERLSVTTTLNGDSAGAKAYGEGEGALERRPHRRDHLRRALRPAARRHDLRRRRHGTGAVPDGKAGRLHDDRLGRARQVRDAGAAAGRRRADRRLAGDGLRRATPLDDATYVVVLTHDPRFDEPALGPALRSDAPYIGALGSRRAQATRRERLLNAGYTDDEIAPHPRARSASTSARSRPPRPPSRSWPRSWPSGRGARAARSR